MEPNEAQALLAAGRLTEALAQVQRDVKSNPADPKPRIFLFQLLCVLGRWEKALTQLSVLPDLDPDTLLMSRAGAAAITCELLRKDVFRGTRLPLVFGEPAEWMGWLVRANQLTSAGQVNEGADLRAKALESAPAVDGSIDGQPFEWIADADERLGPMLEAIIDGRYFWIPLQNVRQLQIDPPTDLRDLVWAPARFTWSNEGNTVGLIPTRYVDSDDETDPQSCLARKTEWMERNGVPCGRGQRLFATDQGEYPILQTRMIQLNVAAPVTPQAGEVGSG